MLLSLLLACRCSSPGTSQDVTFPTHEMRQVGGRFVGEPDGPLDPKVAFAVQARCPRLEAAHLRRANDQIRVVTVRGAELGGVTRIGAALPDGKLATVHFVREGEAIEFPVACTDCEVYFGLSAEGRTAACLGPGYSLTFVDGRIAP